MPVGGNRPDINKSPTRTSKSQAATSKNTTNKGSKSRAADQQADRNRYAPNRPSSVASRTSNPLRNSAATMGIGNRSGNTQLSGMGRNPSYGYSSPITNRSGSSSPLYNVLNKATTGRPTPTRYTLTKSDLSDEVVNTVAKEAYLDDPEGQDAVINVMLNRVKDKAYKGGNLLQIASAPGQFEGYNRGRPSPAQAQAIRDRIIAIANGSTPDNTNGAREFRGDAYTGEWMQKHGATGKNIGGNVYRQGHPIAAETPPATPTTARLPRARPAYETPLAVGVNPFKKASGPPRTQQRATQPLQAPLVSYNPLTSIRQPNYVGTPKRVKTTPISYSAQKSSIQRWLGGDARGAPTQPKYNTLGMSGQSGVKPPPGYRNPDAPHLPLMENKQRTRMRPATQPQPGTRITMATLGLRNQPLSGPLTQVLEQAAAKLGLRVTVTSGGEPKTGPKGSQSGRHDDGNAADLMLTRDGRALDMNVPADRAKMAQFVTISKSLGAKGFGAGSGAPHDYMGPKKMHVDVARENVWGAGGKTANAPGWVVTAASGRPGKPSAQPAAEKPASGGFIDTVFEGVKTVANLRNPEVQRSLFEKGKTAIKTAGSSVMQGVQNAAFKGRPTSVASERTGEFTGKPIVPVPKAKEASTIALFLKTGDHRYLRGLSPKARAKALAQFNTQA